MANEPVAKRYAQALFSLGEEKGQLDEYGQALAQVAELFAASQELRQVLLNPAIKLEERRGVLAALAKRAEWPALFRNFTMLLLDKDRLRYIDAIAEAFRRRLDAHQGRAQARVTSAVALDDEQIKTLKKRLDELTGMDVVMTTDVDDELIGGLVARVGSTVYDGSVRTHLQRMREAILKEV